MSALKIMNKLQHSQKVVELIEQEASTMGKLKHENIVELKQIYESKELIMIEMEYVEGG